MFDQVLQFNKIKNSDMGHFIISKNMSRKGHKLTQLIKK